MLLKRILFFVFLVCITAIFAAAADQSGSASAQTRDEEKSILPWMEIQNAKIATRYNFAANDLGVTTKNHQQHKESFNIKFRLDPKGKYSLNMAAGSGSSFTSSWDNLGIGSDENWHLNVRELYLVARPWDGLDLQYGGISVVRGASTEITSYDGDSFLVGGRLSLRLPKQLFFNEISGTIAYLGDLNEPDVFRRFDRFDQANYHQILVSRNIGKRVTVSGDYTSQWGIATLREAIQVKATELKAVDSIRFENYQRVEGDEAYGFALQADKRIRKWLSVGGGYADIDELYGGLNSDRFNKGKRIFGVAKMEIIPCLSADVFVQQSIANSYSISNDVRLDIALTYDLVPALRKTGIFRTGK